MQILLTSANRQSAGSCRTTVLPPVILRGTLHNFFKNRAEVIAAGKAE